MSLCLSIPIPGGDTDSVFIQLGGWQAKLNTLNLGADFFPSTGQQARQPPELFACIYERKPDILLLFRGRIPPPSTIWTFALAGMSNWLLPQHEDRTTNALIWWNDRAMDDGGEAALAAIREISWCEKGVWLNQPTSRKEEVKKGKILICNLQDVCSR